MESITPISKCDMTMASSSAENVSRCPVLRAWPGAGLAGVAGRCSRLHVKWPKRAGRSGWISPAIIATLDDIS